MRSEPGPEAEVEDAVSPAALLALAVLIPGSASASDTAAQLANVVLILVRNDVVRMEREELYISLDILIMRRTDK